MYNQEEIVLGTLGIMATDDKPALLQMLKESGSLVTELSSRDEILDASIKALRDSDRFRKSLASYMTQAKDTYEIFSNANGTKRTRFDPTTGTGGTRAGNFLRNTFTPEVNQKIIGGIIDFASASLNAKANRDSNRTATDYATAEANRLDREATLASLRGSTPDVSATKSRKWVLPVVIGVGVILIGTTIYFMRKK
jgi:hypothetical protein